MKSKKFISLSIMSFLSVGFLTSALIMGSDSEATNQSIATEAWDINVKPSAEATYYADAEGKTGSALKTALAGFNKPKSKSYDWSRYEAADEAQNDSTSIICIYTRHNIKKSNHVGSSYSWDKWNREHVYTQTAFPQSKEDNHNIFACEGQINNYRGDLKFAEVKDKGGTQVIVKYSGSSQQYPTDCYKTSDLFEPCDEAKGEIARACLYCSVYYGYDLNSIFDSIDTCLKWNAKFTVSPREIYRNNIVQGLQGNRNPFADHPSYAQAIYGGPAYEGTDPFDPGDPVSATGVSLNKSQETISVNGTLQLTATVKPANATNKSVTWSSSDNSVATVSNTGMVRAVKEGTCEITVTTVDGGFTAKCSLTVNEKPTPAPSSGGGCGGNVVTTSIILSTLSILGVGLLLIKRKFTK